MNALTENMPLTVMSAVPQPATQPPCINKVIASKRAWTPEEDALLTALVEQYGAGQWARLSEQLPGRLGKQCRERWFNHVSPCVVKDGWSPEEDALIVHLVEKWGTVWSKIARALPPGRSDNAVKNRWNSTMRKKMRQAVRAERIMAAAQARTLTHATVSTEPASDGAVDAAAANRLPNWTAGVDDGTVGVGDGTAPVPAADDATPFDGACGTFIRCPGKPSTAAAATASIARFVHSEAELKKERNSAKSVGNGTSLKSRTRNVKASRWERDDGGEGSGCQADVAGGSLGKLGSQGGTRKRRQCVILNAVAVQMEEGDHVGDGAISNTDTYGGNASADSVGSVGSVGSDTAYSDACEAHQPAPATVVPESRARHVEPRRIEQATEASRPPTRPEAEAHSEAQATSTIPAGPPSRDGG